MHVVDVVGWVVATAYIVTIHIFVIMYLIKSLFLVQEINIYYHHKNANMCMFSVIIHRGDEVYPINST